MLFAVSVALFNAVSEELKVLKAPCRPPRCKYERRSFRRTKSIESDFYISVFVKFFSKVSEELKVLKVKLEAMYRAAIKRVSEELKVLKAEEFFNNFFGFFNVVSEELKVLKALLFLAQVINSNEFRFRRTKSIESCYTVNTGKAFL